MFLNRRMSTSTKDSSRTDRRNLLRQQRLSTGMCSDCGAAPPVGNWRCQECLDKACRGQRSKFKNRTAQGLCGKCGTPSTNTRCPDCSKQANVYAKTYRNKLTKQVISHYSKGTKQCHCCGETEMLFLTVDHINGGGRQDFIKYGNSTNFYSHLVKTNYPMGFQVLCINCNFGRHRNNGVCPHQADRS